MDSTYSPLYDPAYDHGSCGLGFVARVDGRASHEIVEQGLEVLGNLAHRGATGSDPETGDGAGLLVQVPDAFLRHECGHIGVELPAAGHYGVGMVFLSPDPDVRHACERAFEQIIAEEGQRFLGWRDVPVELDRIGRIARSVAPSIRQIFIGSTTTDEAFSRKLYVIRRRVHRVVHEMFAGAESCYVASLSATTLVYKGLLQGPQLARFYPDLTQSTFASALALVHSRFSTNTLGSWELAHPYRYVAHNGEINTLRGNVNWMRARESQLRSSLFGEDMDRLRPVVEPRASDSSSFDNALELLVLAGRSLPHAVMMMIPEAWENDTEMDSERRAFYQYHSALMEPWDGPAAIAFSDGRVIGATLDRNGLRPARYVTTSDGLIVLASEAGVLPIPDDDVVTCSRLQPGRMLLVDTTKQQLLGDDEVKRLVTRRRPYGSWVQEGTRLLADLPEGAPHPESSGTSLVTQQQAFGYTLEDVKTVFSPMAVHSKEPDGSMGTDTPLAVLSERPQLLFSYFKQLFAQVTNPPIDPLREGLVMSLQMSLGPEENLFEETRHHCRRILLKRPILTGHEVEKLRRISEPPFRAVTLPILFTLKDEELELAVDALCSRAEQAVNEGASILILSDRGVDANHAPIPSLLATAAVHHHLVRKGTRTKTGLVVETGEAREIHHFALLIGYGAVGICPYLALNTVASLAETGQLGPVSPDYAARNYLIAIEAGLRKVISKMGISTLLSYCGAQVFEVVGLDPSLVERHFTGTASRIGGIGLTAVQKEVLSRHERAFAPPRERSGELDIEGQYQYRQQGEYHQWNPTSIASLQRAVRAGSFQSFKEFTTHFDGESRSLATLRGLFDLVPEPSPIPLDEVEPAAEIVKHFSTGAMSFGSISREAHETLAIAMNRIGGKSNTGEGGEAAERFIPDPDGGSRRSAIKQVASGRFGVTAHYLVNADVLQIKMAQGSKPGEGGQIPGHKVTDDIARVRHSVPGIGLISPPPHHDIYSIEDLAQLIHDLKTINPDAQVSVKLVAEVGVGTIAAGVTKAKADHITISGHDGGTGASPLSSIKHAGLPWELGLAETQQVLVANGLRARVRLQADGQIKTGRDVVIAALLGADEVAFSTAPLVAAGCIMMRVCHLNTCPVGIATQDPDLRKKFAGKPEHLVNYFFFLAEEVRRLMAELGFRRFDEMVGRVDRLTMQPALAHWKARDVDLSAILGGSGSTPDAAIRHTDYQDHGLETSPDLLLIRSCRKALETGMPVQVGSAEAPLKICNTDRTVGGMLSGEIASRRGAGGLPDDTIRITFRGTAGQSFGAWSAPGLTMVLQGVTNDYAGKGLSGGKLIIAPAAEARYDPERSIVAGNATLYGATAGEAYIRGQAGERFAVRNSGAHAVVEGVGDHGCEYMTGGVVVVLGPTGRNFAAGMTGGTAFILDTWGRFRQSCNLEMVDLEPVQGHEDIALLRHLLQQHLNWTGSTAAGRVLSNWAEYLPRFVKVMPREMRGILDQRATAELAERAG